MDLVSINQISRAEDMILYIFCMMAIKRFIVIGKKERRRAAT